MPAVSSVLVPYAAYLRVYEPLAAFPPPERERWARYAEGGRALTAQDELRRSLADLLPTPPVPVPVHESADAFVTEADGEVRICPWGTRLRGWLALEELTGRLPAALLDAALPPVVRRQVAADWERWRERHPDARPWIRSALWRVPVRWFVLFDDGEREYEPPGDGAAVLRYRTPMAQARRRVARTLRVLRDAQGPRSAMGATGAADAKNPVDPVDPVDSVRGAARLGEGLLVVGKWLEEFHPRSLVELDYGGLVHALPADRLAGDHSAADVAAGVAALRSGDREAAAESYARLVARWRAVRDRQFAN
ncbi:hypothetical protein [Streptomyces yaizuensis]|uniref:DUF8083 domain-containing protein n=1 Tax=Streptomyces yaizuensis TaxID=2989713 RepID=A0ABQ5P1Y6_9ACTN|nr:hypothetical protein [Streptomyces sp. YSPA8]GLF96534.1 hypothetical protein SYYSPA8_19575 [Streptomyces sp. YSPA8]